MIQPLFMKNTLTRIDSVSKNSLQIQMISKDICTLRCIDFSGTAIIRLSDQGSKNRSVVMNL